MASNGRTVRDRFAQRASAAIVDRPRRQKRKSVRNNRRNHPLQRARVGASPIQRSVSVAKSIETIGNLGKAKEKPCFIFPMESSGQSRMIAAADTSVEQPGSSTTEATAGCVCFSLCVRKSGSSRVLVTAPRDLFGRQPAASRLHVASGRVPWRRASGLLCGRAWPGG